MSADDNQPQHTTVAQYIDTHVYVSGGISHNYYAQMRKNIYWRIFEYN